MPIACAASVSPTSPESRLNSGRQFFAACAANEIRINPRDRNVFMQTQPSNWVSEGCGEIGSGILSEYDERPYSGRVRPFTNHGYVILLGRSASCAAHS